MRSRPCAVANPSLYGDLSHSDPVRIAQTFPYAFVVPGLSSTIW